MNADVTIDRPRRGMLRRKGARPFFRRLLPALFALPTLAIFAMIVGATPAPALARPADQALSDPLTYELVDTWSKSPWRLRPGFFRDVADIAIADDGHRFVLDRLQKAVHVMAPNGTWPQAFLLKSLSGEPSRLDIAPDGSLYVMARVGYAAMVYRYRPDGSWVESFAAPGASAYRHIDIAVGPDGRVYLARQPFVSYPDCKVNGPGPCYPVYSGSGVDVLSAGGAPLEVFGADALAVALRVDVDATGKVFVLNDLPVTGH
jgi:hypothetical protein